MDETKELLLAIKHAVEHTNAKLDALELRNANLEGQMKKGFDEVKTEVRRLKRHIGSLENDLDETINRIDSIESH